ncbi:CHC2 zinc finger domain-containing protein [Anaeroarcus burkinensis]|uniref:CHC2 zinc finger domain-containing protein n=1 Tax=Anaeroarcus burkinensis TaxID=82376 RepID=UPI000488641B|nr:CHC2 zinc finger domain-containing protein [Anaeroarcus burkinensis]
MGSNYLFHVHCTTGGTVQAIKNLYSLQDALQEAGTTVGRNKKALCLWHNDQNPSMHVYQDRVHCFACGRGGDAIDVYAAANGMETKDAVQALAARFGFQSGVMSSTRTIWANQQRQAEREETQSIESAYWALRGLLCRLEQSMQETLPMSEAMENDAARDVAAQIARLLTEVGAVLDGLASEEREVKRKALFIARERGLLT